MASQQLAISTPLGPDALLLTRFRGSEGISRLFRFELDLVAENQTDVPFDKLLGQGVTVHLSLPKGKFRHWNGIVSRVSQGNRTDEITHYRLEMVPLAWRLTRRLQSRIFQHKSVPEILKEVLNGLDVKYEIQGTFHPRNYCSQYAESDFAFASRLMEEEGIWFYFKHLDGAHQLLVANTPPSHADVPEYPKAIFEGVTGGQREDDRVWTWDKSQELCSGKYTLWDHTFELPGKNLEAATTIPDSVAVGKVTHKLKVAANDQLETYLFPGGYAHRFDGIDRSGGERPAELQKIFEDNQRTCKLRMEAEAAASLKIEGSGGCGQFTAGHKFALERHFNADGAYVLTSVEHDARMVGDLHKVTEQTLEYQNTFTCLPAALPFRPPQTTPKPLMQGTQTATVVGPAGEEIHCDKYGRVKVQFHWDRLGQFDGDSSCWVRVAYSTAGKGFGLVVVPRVGQEVVVDFEGGDPDEPVVIGTVFNSDNMPPNALPGDKATLTLRSNTYPGGGGCNEISLKDNAGEQKLNIQAEKDMTQLVKNDKFQEVKNNDSQKVGVNRVVEVGQNHQEKIGLDRAMSIGGSESKDIAMNLLQNIGANQVKNVMATATENVGMVKTIIVGTVPGIPGLGGVAAGKFITEVNGVMVIDVSSDQTERVGKQKNVTVKKNFTTTVDDGDCSTTLDQGNYGVHTKKGGMSFVVDNATFTIQAPKDLCELSAKEILIEATDKIQLKCGEASITLQPKLIQIQVGDDEYIEISKGNQPYIGVQATKVDIKSTSTTVEVTAKTALTLTGTNTFKLTGKAGEVHATAGTLQLDGGSMVQINCK